jgi:hypothetical protein
MELMVNYCMWLPKESPEPESQLLTLSETFMFGAMRSSLLIGDKSRHSLLLGLGLFRFVGLTLPA